MTMARWFLVAVLACPAPAAEEDDAVAAVLKAEGGAFAELAARDEPDPWLVAERLAAAGHGERALRFARAKPRPAVAGLAAFLESNPPFDPQVKLVRDRVLARLDDDRTRRETLAADVAAIAAVLPRANALERAQLLAVRGFARVYLGDVADGQKDFLEAADAAEALGWLRGAADALGVASENARVLYDYDGSVRIARRELELRWRLGDAEAALARVRRLADILGEAGGSDAALAELAKWEARLGDPVRLDRAALLLRLAGMEPALALANGIEGGRAHMIAGDALRQLGREREALDRYRRAAEAFGEDAIRLGHALGNAGLGLLRLGQPADARPLLEKAQLQFDAANDRGLVATAVLYRSEAHLAAGEAPVALRLADAARTFASRAGDPWLEAGALVRRGRALLALGRVEDARKSFTAARSLGEEAGLPLPAAAGALGEARCYERQERAVLARATAERGLAALAPLVDERPVPPGDEARRLHGELCAAAVGAQLALDSDRELWLALERQRIGIPRYTRAQVARIRARSPDDADLRAAIARLSLFEERAREEDDVARAARFRAEREGLERKRAALHARVDDPYAATLLFGKPVPLSPLRQRLAAGEAVASVMPGAVLVLTRAEVRRVPWKPGDTIDARAGRLLLVGPAGDLRWSAADILRAPSATEALRLGAGRATVLADPADARELRRLFLDGVTRVLAPDVPVPKTQFEAMREKGPDAELTRASRWSRWGRWR